MSSRAQRHRVLKRDNRMCGLHMGGCGKPIKQGEQYNVDHIIPRALFSKVAEERIAEFNEDWNCQPTHVACNDSKGFRLSDWPRFTCKCHYLQIRERDLYIYTRGSVGKGIRKLIDTVVSDRNDRVDAKIIIGTGTGKDGSNIAGYWKDRFGYSLPGIAASRVEMFNLTERGRAGLSVPKRVQLDEQGRIVARWGPTGRFIQSVTTASP